MGQWYIPPYSADCFERLEAIGWCMIGKCSMDEFAMWWANENPHYGPCKNPHDHMRISWWSSWWSAAAVANDECLAALGTDTWWSVRQPAALCGVVGAKPTYGRVSRFGVQSMASSLDQVWTLAKTVEDAAIVLKWIAWYDERDSTSQAQADKWIMDGLDAGVQWLKFALPKQYLSEWIDDDVKQSVLHTVEQLKAQWATIDEIDLPLLSYWIPAYYILMPAEAHSNLSRFDGMRFGHQWDTKEFDTIYDYYATVRDQWFGDEVKRRILTWAYVLSAGFYDAYYSQAKRFQVTLRNQLNTAFWAYSAIIGPTSPVPAWKIGEKSNDPIANYLADIYTVTANLAGLPALSVPISPVERDGISLPVWFQIMTKARDESMMFRIWNSIEKM
jgi:aspartyl-tRNA(Asn)/glutamyl-tRNA(Gln) amidotransferase subunit A